ncbi:hypothetical protein E2320_012393 [Naja naja]|nr:hypothetical protein E2320_012393 [Naja naja]
MDQPPFSLTPPGFPEEGPRAVFMVDLWHPNVAAAERQALDFIFAPGRPNAAVVSVHLLLVRCCAQNFASAVLEGVDEPSCANLSLLILLKRQTTQSPIRTAASETTVGLPRPDPVPLPLTTVSGSQAGQPKGRGCPLPFLKPCTGCFVPCLGCSCLDWGSILCAPGGGGLPWALPAEWQAGGGGFQAFMGAEAKRK